VCSSDAIYRSDGAAAVAALREAGATKIYLAGRGLDLVGVDEEIGLGSDVLAVVTSTLDELGLEDGDEVEVET
jgi:methylmalonyl-CoA mutase